MPDPKYDPTTPPYPCLTYPIHADAAEPIAGLVDSVQCAVNAVAEQSLGARAVFPSTASPDGLAGWPSWGEGIPEGGVVVATLSVRPAPRRLWAEFTVPALAVERGDWAGMSDLRAKVRLMARKEDELVLEQVLGVSRSGVYVGADASEVLAFPVGTPPPEGDTDEERARLLARAVFGAAGDIRAASDVPGRLDPPTEDYVGALALVLTSIQAEGYRSSGDGEHTHVSSLFAATGRGREIADQFDLGVHTARLPATIRHGVAVVGLVADVAASGVTIAVGQNYQVSWLGREGPDHRFGVCTTLATRVGNPDALRVLVLGATLPGA